MIGSDTGGTFTDLVADDGTVTKVPSTPGDPGEAVRAGLAELLGEGVVPAVLAHGTTVATNALLERTGARVALVTNVGFADVIEIARQDRPSLHDPAVVRPEPLVPRGLRLEVPGRLGADGRELEPLGPRAGDPRRRGGGCGLPPAQRSPARPRDARRDGAGGQRSRRELLVRRLTRVPRVRAHGDDGGQRLPPTGVPHLPAPAVRGRRFGAGDDLGRWSGAGRRRGRTSRGAAALGSRRGRAGRRRGRGRQRLPRRRDLRHGRHLDRRVPGARRHAGARGRAGDRRPTGAHAVDGRAHDRCRRRLHRPSRRRRRAARRTPQRRRRARTGLLRPGRHRADRDRRRPGGRAHPGRGGVPRAGRARRGCGTGGARRGGRQRRRCDLAWSTRPWRKPSGS